jgi:hypothetical protein
VTFVALEVEDLLQDGRVQQADRHGADARTIRSSMVAASDGQIIKLDQNRHEAKRETV